MLPLPTPPPPAPSAIVLPGKASQESQQLCCWRGLNWFGAEHIKTPCPWVLKTIKEGILVGTSNRSAEQPEIYQGDQGNETAIVGLGKPPHIPCVRSGCAHMQGCVHNKERLERSLVIYMPLEECEAQWRHVKNGRNWKPGQTYKQPKLCVPQSTHTSIGKRWKPYWLKVFSLTSDQLLAGH